MSRVGEPFFNLGAPLNLDLLPVLLTYLKWYSDLENSNWFSLILSDETLSLFFHLDKIVVNHFTYFKIYIFRVVDTESQWAQHNLSKMMILVKNLIL